ncbi:MAG: hypothetical protein K940chlam2_01458 [Chlamydiae bacterium]|nr:hypothetical protein [Chlamydiota bacterium]
MAKSKKQTRSEAKEKLDKDDKNKSSDPKGQSKWQEYLRKYSPSKSEKKSQ